MNDKIKKEGKMKSRKDNSHPSKEANIEINKEDINWTEPKGGTGKGKSPWKKKGRTAKILGRTLQYLQGVLPSVLRGGCISVGRGTLN